MVSKYLNKFSKLLELFTVISFITLVIVILIQMASRYFKLTGTGWTDEIISCTTAWMVFLGTSYLAERGGHVSVSLLEDSLHGYKKSILRIVIQLVNVISGVILSYSGFIWSLSTANKRTQYLQIRYNIWYSAIFVFGILFAFFSIFKLLESFIVLFKKDTSIESE
ncbi:MAG TPA: TRAP transporter small permease subunit [Bacillota bacterium]|nr:TRAP transporter small permease subunit [Bacillota bacterium]HOR85635.1 TRAP transporter small permease subunit [Bacillota bacterium]